MRHSESSESWREEREADPPPRHHHQIASEREKSDRNDYSSLPIATVAVELHRSQQKSKNPPYLQGEVKPIL